MIKRNFLAYLLSSMLFFSSLAIAMPLNSASITAATLRALPHCVHYRVRGVCYWQSVAGPITTPYIEQYLPDLVVVVFDKPGDNPWEEMNATIDAAGQAVEEAAIQSMTSLSAGSGQHSLANNHEQTVFFKEAEVIGNPAVAALPSTPVLLPAVTTPLLLYYQSMLDSLLWRGLPVAGQLPPEELYAVAAGMTHVIGSSGLDWGSIYPHEGKVAASNDAKAAAVIAQRAADLITNNNLVVSGHVVQSPASHCGQECTAAPIQENSPKTKFQLIYPEVQTNCDYFGKTLIYGEDLKDAFEKNANGAYAWVIWRFYRGCVEGEGVFIGKIILPE
jgi:integrating conjugative element protein (TIGR03756 family)